MNPSKIVACYFLIQALSTIAWWVLLISYLPSVKWFQPNSWPAESLLSFWLADFVLLISGSLIAAFGVLRQFAWASNVVWAVAITAWYPTLVCLATSMHTGEAWIASSLMVSMAGMSLAIATIQGKANQKPAAIRVTGMQRPQAVIWTLGQTVIFWGVFLWVLPLGIVEFERYCGIDTFEHAHQSHLAVVMFTIASCLGLWSGMTMAIHGNGTPLPTATAPRLVVAGPYRFVRNPMAVAGILQGLSVAWYLGSYGVLVYSLAGAVLWHIVVRPVEESDLKLRFGETYQVYQRCVLLWVPTSGRKINEIVNQDENES